MKTIDEKIRDLITTKRFHRHSDICAALQAEGYPVNQSTISRLLHKLGAVKTLDDKGQAYYRIRPQAVRYLATNLVDRVVATETLVIIFTSSGAAGHVAEFIDRAHLPQIAGTLAGDNNIFVAPHSAKDIHVLENIFREMFL